MGTYTKVVLVIELNGYTLFEAQANRCGPHIFFRKTKSRSTISFSKVGFDRIATRKMKNVSFTINNGDHEAVRGEQFINFINVFIGDSDEILI